MSFDSLSELEAELPPSRREILRRRVTASFIGLLAVAAVVKGVDVGISKMRDINRSYQERRELQAQPTDMELVKKYVSESKYHDRKTGKVRLLPRHTGGIAGYTYINEKGVKQTDTLSNFLLVVLSNGHSYVYGENHLEEPIIWNRDDVTTCAARGAPVRIEMIELGHNNLYGGMAVTDTGVFQSNDADWPTKCQPVNAPTVSSTTTTALTSRGFLPLA